MKALAWFGTDDVRVIDAPIPDITEADDVVIKVTGTTICGEILNSEKFKLSADMALRIGSASVPWRNHGFAER